MKIKIFTVMFFAISLFSCKKENLSSIERSKYVGNWKHSSYYVFNNDTISNSIYISNSFINNITGIFINYNTYREDKISLELDPSNENQLREQRAIGDLVCTIIDSKSFRQSDFNFVGSTANKDAIGIRVTNIIGTFNDPRFISLKGDVIVEGLDDGGLINGVKTTIKGTYFGSWTK